MNIPLKQQVRDISKKLQQAINDKKIAHDELRKSESRHLQLQRSVNAYHIRLEALKMASSSEFENMNDDSIRVRAIQFEKWLLNGFEDKSKSEEE